MAVNGTPQGGEGTGRAVIVHVHRRSAASRNAARAPEARLAEATGLARAIDLDVVDALVATVAQPHPATLLRPGKVAEIAALVSAGHADLVIVDAPLTPVQQRNLEKAWSAKVIDRTGLILEIFGERARTNEGRLQVELAALTYQRSRLVRSWTHLERQRGGFGFLGGPGESQLEADRRQIDTRITRIRRSLGEVSRTRDLHRRERQKVPYPVVALVGYTNAGKSTLFNRLTRSEVFAADLLFATLDPTMRQVRLPGGETIILSDTVGFISNLPHELVAAFSATLEEVVQADIVVHVRDVSHPESAAQKADVERVLGEIGVRDGEAGHARFIEVQNKIDQLDPAERERVETAAARHPDIVPLSALTGEGCDRFLSLLEEEIARGRHVRDITLPPEDGAAMAWLYRHGEVLERSDDDTGVHLRVRLSPANLSRFERGPAR